jgi:hypothetical protein
MSKKLWLVAILVGLVMTGVSLAIRPNADSLSRIGVSSTKGTYGYPERYFFYNSHWGSAVCGAPNTTCPDYTIRRFYVVKFAEDVLIWCGVSISVVFIINAIRTKRRA